MANDPLRTTVLDLDAALGCDADLLLGGGFGLYLKQMHLEQTSAKTLLPRARWPRARTTEDIDLFLKAEIVADPSRMAEYRRALDQLGFEPVEDAKWLKFARNVEGKRVLIDLMVGPLGDLESRVERRNVRIKPMASAGLHARAADDALAVEHNPIRLELRSQERSCHVLVPQAFSFALMKLGALRDRIRDADKDEGRHHALDLYRIMAMLTEEEDTAARELAAQYADHEVLLDAVRVIDELLTDQRGMGRVRLREHPLCPEDADVDWLAAELRRLLLP
jgi:hypothetical protein